MTKDAVVIVLGLVVALMPFLGFPSTWETIILVAIGLLIALLAFLLRQDVLQRGYQHKREAADVFVESGMHQDEHAESSTPDETHASETN